MDRLTLTFYVIAAIFGLIGLAICVGFSVHFYRKGLKGMLRLMLPAGILAIIVLVQSISFLAAYFPR